MLSRRAIVAGLFAAPVVVKAASLMKLAPTEVLKPYSPRFLTVPQVRVSFPNVFLTTGDTMVVRSKWTCDVLIPKDHELVQEFLVTRAGMAADAEIVERVRKVLVDNKPLPGDWVTGTFAMHNPGGSHA